MARPNKPTKDKIRRGGCYLEFNPGTVLRPPQLTTPNILPDQAIAATQELNQSMATHDMQAARPETIRPGSMCLRALAQSPHYQAFVAQQAEAQAA